MVYSREYQGKQQQALSYLSQLNRLHELPRFQQMLYHVKGLMNTFLVPQQEIEQFEQHLIEEAKSLAPRGISELMRDEEYKSQMTPDQLMQAYTEIGMWASGEIQEATTKAQRTFLSVMARTISEKMFDISARYRMPALPQSVESFMQGLLNPARAQEPRFSVQISKSLQNKLLLAGVPEAETAKYLDIFRTARSQLAGKYGADADMMEMMKQEDINVSALTPPQRGYMSDLLEAERIILDDGTKKFGKQEDKREKWQRGLKDMLKGYE